MSVKTASLYRMVTPSHVCPSGLKAKDLLERKGYRVEDHPLRSREETDAFKAEHGVATTPRIFIAGEPIGGYEDLRRYLGQTVGDGKAASYRPIVAVFTMTALMAIAASEATLGQPFSARAGAWFVAFSMCALAMLKLQDIERFSTMFLTYDLLARRWVRYSYVYPFAEGLAGVLMIAGILGWLSGLVALAIGTIGAASVVKAVYIDKRVLHCACAGGSARVPLGFVSLTENLMMMAMGLATLRPLLTA